jgi:hypothetical protein
LLACAGVLAREKSLYVVAHIEVKLHCEFGKADFFFFYNTGV